MNNKLVEDRLNGANGVAKKDLVVIDDSTKRTY
jgi:hypothetical protein